MKHNLIDAYAHLQLDPTDDDRIMVMVSSWEDPETDPKTGLLLQRHVTESVRVSLSQLHGLHDAIPENARLYLPYDAAQQFKKDGMGIITDALDTQGKRIPAHQSHYWNIHTDGSASLYRADIIYAKNGMAHSVNIKTDTPLLAITSLQYTDLTTPHIIAHLEDGYYTDFEDRDGNPLPAKILFHSDETIVQGHYYKRGVETGHIQGKDFENDFVRTFIKQSLHRHNNMDLTLHPLSRPQDHPHILQHTKAIKPKPQHAL
jgi:hypothetical protein